MTEQIDEELKIVLRINRFFTENELEEITDVEERDASVRDLKILQQDYEEIHVNLRRQLGDVQYTQIYDKYDDSVKLMMDWLKTAKRKIRNLKSSPSTKFLDELRVEEKFVHSRINYDFQTLLNEKTDFIEDLERHVSVVENLIKEYSVVFMKIENQGAEFKNEFGTRFEGMCKILRDFITSRRNSIHDRREADQMAEKKRLFDESVKKFEVDRENKILSSQNIFSHIFDRFSNLESKLKVEINDLSDLQILDKSKEVKLYDRDVNDILDKILKLSETHPERYEETMNLNVVVTDRKKNLMENLNDLKDSLNREINSRGISEEKVKNASLLGIELPKFGGYKSKLDFYSFKSKFEKLIAPKVKHDLLSEHLKLKYLEGQALQTVKEMDDIKLIWERLEDSFGHVPTLLNQKLEDLEKSTPLEKIQKDHKIIETLLRIQNLMKELSKLARDHGLEHTLYHPSNLARLYNFLGKKRQLKIVRDLINENATDKESWDHILDSLDKELRVREKISVLNKCNGNTRSEKINSGSTEQTSLDDDDLSCHICGETDHIPKITNNGRKIINYHACDKFVVMNPKLRFDVLKENNLCRQCLSPGRKHGHKGKCISTCAR